MAACSVDVGSGLFLQAAASVLNDSVTRHRSATIVEALWFLAQRRQGIGLLSSNVVLLPSVSSFFCGQDQYLMHHMQVCPSLEPWWQQASAAD